MMALRFLIPIFIVIPALEIMLLLYSGKLIGGIPTFLLIIATGILGAYLAKKQGLAIIQKAQRQMSHGEIPSEAIVDGICILLGGLLLLTPGFITDTAGFLLLFPGTRKFVKPLLLKWLRRFFQTRSRVTIIR
ncbi:membrane protein FxsA [Priestia megaterium]|nr:membrane protein FxsA [Priestia megaterium]